MYKIQQYCIMQRTSVLLPAQKTQAKHWSWYVSTFVFCKLFNYACSIFCFDQLKSETRNFNLVLQPVSPSSRFSLKASFWESILYDIFVMMSGAALRVLWGPTPFLWRTNTSWRSRARDTCTGLGATPGTLCIIFTTTGTSWWWVTSANQRPWQEAEKREAFRN